MVKLYSYIFGTFIVFILVVLIYYNKNSDKIQNNSIVIIMLKELDDTVQIFTDDNIY
jgi:hypothetical protein